MKKNKKFLSESFQYLLVEFSLYLNRRVCFFFFFFLVMILLINTYYRY